jgi:hypothetical protein
MLSEIVFHPPATPPPMSITATARSLVARLSLLGLCLAPFVSAQEVATEYPPELRGILFLSGSRQFALATPGGTESGWSEIGGTFAGWKLVEFREEGEVLVVDKGDGPVELQLESSNAVDSAAATAKATLADAQALMEKMNFEQMFEKMIEQQKASVVNMTRQMGQQMGQEGVDPDALAAFQGEVMDVMWAEMNPAMMAKEMTTIYSEVFTRSELRAMSEFYSTPAGRATIEKTPEIQQRTMEIIQPRMMAAMPRIQQMAQEFARRQQENQAAPDAEAVPAPAP